MGISVYSITLSVVFFNLALLAVFILRRSSAFLARNTLPFLGIVVLFGVVHLLIPIDLDIAHVVRSYQILPAIEDFLNRPVVGRITVTSLLLLVWLVGTLVFVVRDVVEQLHFVKSSRNYPPADRRDLLDLAGEYGDNFGLLVSPVVSRPYVAGLFRPVIYLPDISLTEEQWRTVFRHETQHIKSRDEWKKLFFLAIQALFWWNPLAHISRKEIDTLIELQCDAKVTAKMSGEEVDAYLDTLQTVKDRTSAQRIPATSSPLVWDQTQIEARFQALKNTKNAKGKALCIGLSTALALVILLSYLVIVQPVRYAPGNDIIDGVKASDEFHERGIIENASAMYIVYSEGTYLLYMDGEFVSPIDEENLSKEPFSSLPILGG